MVISSLVAETIPYTWVRAVAAPMAIGYGGHILSLHENTHYSHNFSRSKLIFMIYSVVFIIGVVNSVQRNIVDIMFEASDTIMKTVTSLVIIVNAYEQSHLGL